METDSVMVEDSDGERLILQAYDGKEMYVEVTNKYHGILENMFISKFDVHRLKDFIDNWLEEY